jgi:DNA-directed RNA polymerase II subunit RPB3
VNTSVLHEEFLGHRLCLIPIRSDKTLVSRDLCKCEGHCAFCAATFSLDETCVGAAMDITTAHLKPSDPEIAPVVEGGADGGEGRHILICRLRQGQQLKFTAIARAGIGKLHAKWNPVCVATYQFDPLVQLNYSVLESLPPEKRAEFARVCPTEVFRYDDKTKQVSIPEENMSKCMFCNECVDKAAVLEAKDLVTVSQKEEGTRFVFKVETTGALSPEAVVATAFKVLREKIGTVHDKLNSEASDLRWDTTA